MSTSTTFLASPFDAISGDLLPAYREEYVQGRLRPAQAETIETYLKSSPIQTNIVLGRAHALLAAAQAEGRPFAPPLWVQEQLRFQPASVVGPLRRPVVRLILGLFLALIGASIVQWLRNEPLVPAPVARVVAQAASSAQQVTQHLVQRLTKPSSPAPAAAVPVAAASAKPAVRPPHLQAARPAPVAPAQVRPTQVALAVTQPADSLAAEHPAAATPAAAPTTTVRGRITDGQGRPIPGATVLVQGTHQATSANATGEYELTAPIGSTLQYGYGGYTDQLQRNSGADNVNVTLLPNTPTGSSARRRH